MIIITPTAQAAAAQASDASQEEELRRTNAESLKGERAAQINSVQITLSTRQHHLKMNGKQLPELSSAEEGKGAPTQSHLLMRPPSSMFRASADKENRRPERAVDPIRHQIRHHNPGTPYRPDPRVHRRPAPDSRIRLVSSVLVVPPTTTAGPLTNHDSSTSRLFDKATQTTPPVAGQVKNRTAPKWTQSKTFKPVSESFAWRQNNALLPTPHSEVDYSSGFKIFPGKAYQPVLWYENRDAVWPPHKHDIHKPSRPHFYDDTGADPRSIDLRVHLNKLNIKDLREHLNQKRNAPKDTPEQAVARLHGKEASTSSSTLGDELTLPQPSKATTEEELTRILEESTGQTQDISVPAKDDPWPTPGRRRRRCRMVIIYDKPTSREEQQ